MKPRSKSVAVLSLVALVTLLGGCRGKLVATASLRNAGAVDIKFRPPGKKLVLWADTDMKWKGPKTSKPDVSYEIEIMQGGKVVNKVSCSTNERAGTSICGSHSNIMGTHDADCEIELACSFPALSGEVELHVVGKTGPNVISSQKMSLNIREE